LKIFVARDALVDSRADAAAFAERAAQPGGIGFAHALAGNADPDLNATFEEEGNQIVKRRSFVNRWRAAAFAAWEREGAGSMVLSSH